MTRYGRSFRRKKNPEVKGKCETETIKIEKLEKLDKGWVTLLTILLQATVLYAVRTSSKFHWSSRMASMGFDANLIQPIY